jgi:predicted DNA-binding transcriptional regulator AlpA
MRRTPSEPVTSTVERRLLTVAAVLEELKVPRSTFYKWRRVGLAPRCIKLPNGDVRIRRADLDAWLKDREDAAA